MGNCGDSTRCQVTACIGAGCMYWSNLLPTTTLGNATNEELLKELLKRMK
jgi:hypothetical protein